MFFIPSLPHRRSFMSYPRIRKMILGLVLVGTVLQSSQLSAQPASAPAPSNLPAVAVKNLWIQPVSALILNIALAVVETIDASKRRERFITMVKSTNAQEIIDLCKQNKLTSALVIATKIVGRSIQGGIVTHICSDQLKDPAKDFSATLLKLFNATPEQITKVNQNSEDFSPSAVRSAGMEVFWGLLFSIPNMCDLAKANQCEKLAKVIARNNKNRKNKKINEKLLSLLSTERGLSLVLKTFWQLVFCRSQTFKINHHLFSFIASCMRRSEETAVLAKLARATSYDDDDDDTDDAYDQAYTNDSNASTIDDDDNYDDGSYDSTTDDYDYDDDDYDDDDDYFLQD